MSEIMHRRFLREKEAIQILDEFSQKLKVDLRRLLEAKNPGVETAETPAAEIFFLNGQPLLARFKQALVPTLLFDKALQLLPKITVNMGAVPHICNGADIMAPGVVKIEGDFNADEYVLVVDERHQKPLAIALAITDSRATRSLQHGKIAKNMHYVGDSLWNQIKKA